MVITSTRAAYLEAGVAIRALTNGGLRGDPFIKDNQPGTWPGTLRGNGLLHEFT